MSSVEISKYIGSYVDSEIGNILSGKYQESDKEIQKKKYMQSKSKYKNIARNIDDQTG